MPWDSDRTWVVGDEFPYTTSQINRTGDRIGRAAARAEPPAADDLEVLDLYRSWHSPILTRLQSRLDGVLNQLGDAVSPATSLVGRPLKTRAAIVAKLVCEKSRLARIQDIAGTRVVVPTLAEQEVVLAAALTQLGTEASVVKDTREAGDALGYRALHVVVRMDGRLAVVQIRTATQASWAQIVEILDEQGKTDLKHGNGPAETLEWLRQASDALRRVDLGEAKLADALVALGLGGIVTLMQNRKAE